MKEREITFNNFRASMASYAFRKSISLGKVSMIESFNPNDIDGSIIQKTVHYGPFEEGSPFVKFNGLIKNLHVFHLSNALKHFKALEVIAQSEDNSINLILEDDVSFDPKTVFSKLEEAIQKYEPGSILFLGMPNNNPQAKEINIVPTEQLFELLPYNDSYLVDKTAAKKLLDSFLPIKFITNLQLSLTIKKADVKCYQTIPNIFVDGSKLGIFTSSMSANNVLVFNGDYMKIREIINKDEITPEDRAIAEQLFANSPCSPHPDFQYLKGQYYVKEKDYKKALDIFQGAYDVYTKNMCIMNHESQFLKEYMRTYKHMQSISSS